MRLTVAENGKPEDCKIQGSVGDPDFARAAFGPLLKNAQFQPPSLRESRFAHLGSRPSRSACERTGSLVYECTAGAPRNYRAIRCAWPSLSLPEGGKHNPKPPQSNVPPLQASDIEAVGARWAIEGMRDEGQCMAQLIPPLGLGTELRRAPNLEVKAG